MSHVWTRHVTHTNDSYRVAKTHRNPSITDHFHKRATKYGSLLQTMTYTDKGSYESSPSCITHINKSGHIYERIIMSLKRMMLVTHMKEKKNLTESLKINITVWSHPCAWHTFDQKSIRILCHEFFVGYWTSQVTYTRVVFHIPTHIAVHIHTSTYPLPHTHTHQGRHKVT